MNDLENRCLKFAVSIRMELRSLSKSIANTEDIKQVVRSSGAIGSNYIEANESLGEKDKVFRMRIARKEAKETTYWLSILKNTNPEQAAIIQQLLGEAEELTKIISAIISKLER